MVSLKVERTLKAQQLSFKIEKLETEMGLNQIPICHKKVKGLITIRIKKNSCIASVFGGMTKAEVLMSLQSTFDYVYGANKKGELNVTA